MALRTASPYSAFLRKLNVPLNNSEITLLQPRCRNTPIKRFESAQQITCLRLIGEIHNSKRMRDATCCIVDVFPVPVSPTRRRGSERRTATASFSRSDIDGRWIANRLVLTSPIGGCNNEGFGAAERRLRRMRTETTRSPCGDFSTSSSGVWELDKYPFSSVCRKFEVLRNYWRNRGCVRRGIRRNTPKEDISGL